MVGNLKIEYHIDRQVNISTNADHVMWAIELFKYHPSILKIKKFMSDKGMSFSFSYTTQEKIDKTLQKLDKKKTRQENDIYLKILKSHNDVFSYFIHHRFNNLFFSSIFLSEFKKANILPFGKRRANLISKIIVRLVPFPFSLKFMRGVCLIKCIVILIRFSINISLDSDKVTTLNAAFF